MLYLIENQSIVEKCDLSGLRIQKISLTLYPVIKKTTNHVIERAAKST